MLDTQMIAMQYMRVKNFYRIYLLILYILRKTSVLRLTKGKHGYASCLKSGDFYRFNIR